STRPATSPSTRRISPSSPSCPAGTAPSWNARTWSTRSRAHSRNRLPRSSSALEVGGHLGGRALPGTHRAVQESGPAVGGFGTGPEDPVDRRPQVLPVGVPGAGWDGRGG